MESRRAGFLKAMEGDGCLFVAVAKGAVVGCLGVEARRGVGDLGMMVAAPWRGRGIGTTLLEACLEWARQTGLHKLTLEVFPHNEAAIGLYRKLGFEQEGYLRRHERRRSGELWDVVVMGLVLAE